MRAMWNPRFSYYIMLRKGVGFSYAEKNGHLVLKNETTWKKINGIWINTRLGCFWIEFRRYTL